MKVLLLEDEPELSKSIADFITKNSKFSCDISNTLFRATELCTLYDYDCFLVDLGLPDGSGLELVRLAKQKNAKAGIIIISARDAIEDRIEGLNLGADDFLVKPFHLSELNARIHSLMRRLKFDGSTRYVLNEINIDTQSREVTINQTKLDLTKSEYDLLIYFITNKNQVLSKTSIAEHLVGEYVDGLDSLDFVYLHIKNLRKKMVQSGCVDYIKSVYGVGYKFLVE